MKHRLHAFMSGVGIVFAAVLLTYFLLSVGYAKGYEAAKQYYRDRPPQDDICGWCSLNVLLCEGRCKEHDECGPWCMLWRKLVYNGVIKDNGVHKLSTEEVLEYKNKRDSIVPIHKIHPNKESN